MTTQRPHVEPLSSILGPGTAKKLTPPPSPLSKRRNDPIWERDRQILQTQLHNILIALRTNVKFSSKMRFVAASQGEDHALTQTVKNLRQRLYSPLCERDSFTDSELLQPFSNVALSEETTGPITGVALSAFIAFLDHNCSFIKPESIAIISHCATHAKSEVTDTQSHEAVLARILQVLVSCIKHEASCSMAENNIIQMFRGALAIAVHGEPSELLRRTAEQALHDMVTTIYTRVHKGTSSGLSYARVFAYISGLITVTSTEKLVKFLPEDSVGPLTPDAEHTILPQSRLLGLSLAHTAMLVVKESLLLPQNAELLLVVRDDLCRALLKIGRQKNEHIVIVSQLLRTIHIVVAYASSHIIPQLLSFIVSLHLYPACASLSETFSKPVDPALSDGTEMDIQERYEMIMESLLEFCSEPAFPPFVFDTYDLDCHAPNVFENLCKFLANAFVTPSAGQAVISQLHVVALDCILAMLLTIATRCHSRVSSPIIHEDISRRQQAKDQLLKFAKAFEADPKKSMALLKSECKLLGTGCHVTGWDIGEFLFHHRDVLNKVSLGDFIAELGKDPNPPAKETDTDGALLAKWEEEKENSHAIAGRMRFHQQLLKGYINCHSFVGKHLVRGMREFLSGFRIPGEAQKIDRCMEEFSAQWFSCNRDAPKEVNPFAGGDACFVFSFSCIMLNTDLHSKSIAAANKMTLPQFMSMNRGINGGGNLPDEYITGVYYEILNNEMKLRDFVYDAFEDDFLWSAEVQKSIVQQETARVAVRTTEAVHIGAQDNVVFSVLWRPALTALAYVVDVVGQTSLQPGSKEAFLMQNVLDGFHLCASIAQHFRRADVVDQIVVTLCRYSNALSLRNPYKSVLDFSSNLRGMHSIRTIFSIVRTCGNSLQDSWKDVTELVVRMYLLGLLPEQWKTDPAVMAIRQATDDSMLDMYHGTKSSVFYFDPGFITPEMKSGGNQDNNANKGWLSSFFGTSEAAVSARAAQLKKEQAMLNKVRTLVEECDVTSIFEANSTMLDDDSLTHLVRGILRVGWQEKNVSTVLRVDAHSMSFCIHATTCVLLSNVRREKVVMPLVREYCTNILNSASANIEAMAGQPSNYSQKNTTYYWMTVGSNTCLCLLRLWFNSLPTYHDEFFALIDALKPQSFAAFASTYVCGLFYACVKKNPPASMASSATQWEVIVRLCHKAALLTQNNKARVCAFSVLTYIAGLGEYAWPDAVPPLVDALAQVYLICVQENLKSKGVSPFTSPASGGAAPEVGEDWDVIPTHAEPQPPTCEDVATPAIECERVRLEGIVEILYSFHERLVRNMPKPLTPVWVKAWFSVLRGLCTIVFTVDGTLPGRKGGDAMLALQRALLDPTLSTCLTPATCMDVVKLIVIPLVEKLCNPQQAPNASSSPGSQQVGGGAFHGILSTLFGVEDTPSSLPAAHSPLPAAQQEEVQARSLSLLVKVFLHYVLQLSQVTSEFQALWSKILAMLYAYHTRPPAIAGSAQGSDSMVCDSVREGVKNLVFVLSSLVVADKNTFLQPYPEFWSTTKALVRVFDFSGPLMPHLDAMESMK